MLVFIIEDDDGIRAALAELICQEGLGVVAAHDGREGLALLKSIGGLPDLILLDLVMPGMDGRAFLAEKANCPGLSKIPVVVMSATKADLSGPDIVGVLQKPFNLDVICSYLRAVKEGGFPDRASIPTDRMVDSCSP